jgi:hypothetical protein
MVVDLGGATLQQQQQQQSQQAAAEAAYTNNDSSCSEYLPEAVLRLVLQAADADAVAAAAAAAEEAEEAAQQAQAAEGLLIARLLQVGFSPICSASQCFAKKARHILLYLTTQVFHSGHCEAADPACI